MRWEGVGEALGKGGGKGLIHPRRRLAHVHEAGVVPWMRANG